VSQQIERPASRSTLLAPVTVISEADVRDTLPALLADLTDRNLQPTLVDAAGGAVLRIRDHERQHQTTLAHLARNLTHLRTPRTPEGIRSGVDAWVAARPATDAQATNAGVAGLDWTDGCQRHVGWRIIVVRDGKAMPWQPSPDLTDTALDRARTGAMARARYQQAVLQVTGTVALWTAANLPIISTALLTDPDHLLAEMTRAGLRLRDPQVIITPGRPVACATAGAARRLVEETAAPHVMLPWRAITDLSWV
jgi:hypothetical protein